MVNQVKEFLKLESASGILLVLAMLLAGWRPSEPGEPLNAPIVPASNFELGGDLLYARTDATPTWTARATRSEGLPASARAGRRGRAQSEQNHLTPPGQSSTRFLPASFAR